MAVQDISSKVMLSHNDVFSDIINCLVFERHYLDEEKLKDVIPASPYKDIKGNLRFMERDLIKEYGEGIDKNYFAIAEFGIGNQTTVDPTMPVRVMGYDYTVYKKQLIDKKHNFQRLKYSVDALDMLYAYTKDDHYLNIRNKIVKKEMNGEVINMGDFFDQVEENKIIETVKKQYSQKHNEEYAISFIECGLNISPEEAKEIFEKEILGAELQ